MPKCPTGETYNSTLKACRPQKRRGRKPGTRKSNCSAGKVYNRTLKACRTMKKRGRPAKKSSGSPMLPMPPTPSKMSYKSSVKNHPALPMSKSSSAKRITFTMTVRPSANIVGADKIIAWYMPYFADFELGTKPSITYNAKTDRYEASFIPDPNFPTDTKEQLVELDSFVDPDDNGNYPITIGKQRYLVSGVLRSLHGKKVVDGENGMELA